MIHFINHLTPIGLLIFLAAIVLWFLGYMIALYLYFDLIRIRGRAFTAIRILTGFLCSLFSWLSVCIIYPKVEADFWAEDE